METQQMIEDLQECYAATVSNIFAYFKDDERSEMLNELRVIVENSCKHEAWLKTIDNIKTNLLKEYSTKEDSENAVQNIITDFKKAVNEISVNISDNEKLLRYDQQVKMLQESEGTVDENTSDNDEELQVTGSSITVIDPISKVRMTEPVKNVVCGHTYEKKNILALINVNNRTRCPVIGCNNAAFISKATLIKDMAMLKYLKKNPA